MPSLEDHIFLGYDADTGNPVFYPALPDPDSAWYTLADNGTGPSILDLATGDVLPTVYIQNADGQLGYLVPRHATAETSHQSIGINASLYQWAELQVAAAGYGALDGDTFLAVGEEQLRLVLAYNGQLKRYDLIAFDTVVELSAGGTVMKYVTSQAIFIATGFAEAVGSVESLEKEVYF